MAKDARIDNLLHTYAGECDHVYEARTRGDYTFLGILSTLLSEVMTPEEWETLESLRNGTAKVVAVPLSAQPLADWERELLTSRPKPS